MKNFLGIHVINFFPADFQAIKNYCLETLLALLFVNIIYHTCIYFNGTVIENRVKNNLAMKKISLLCLLAFSIFAADAQTKKSKKSKNHPSKETVAKARFMKVEAQKKLMRDSLMLGMKMEDSLRIAGDNTADLQKDSLSFVYRTNGLKDIDSLNKIRYATIAKSRSEVDLADKTQMDISRAAKLNDYQSKQVKYINQTYTEKAKLLIGGIDPQTKKQELAVLNEERRNKIRVIVGKSRERKLENERKDYFKKNTADISNEWINIAESVAVK